jgi:hypothetical protein
LAFTSPDIDTAENIRMFLHRCAVDGLTSSHDHGKIPTMLGTIQFLKIYD